MMSQQEIKETPSGWKLAPIHSIVSEANTGLVRSAKEQHIKGQYPYIKMNNLTNSGKFDLRKMVYVDAVEKDLIKGQLHAGDFVFNTRNSAELVGKCGVFKEDSNSAILFNNNLLRMRFSEVMPEIVSYWLNSPLGKQQLSSVTSATTNVAAIYQKSLLKLEVPLAPLLEQKRIVEKLDSLLAQVDTIQQRLNNLPNIIKRFRQSVLAAAVSGKLTGDWSRENNCKNWQEVVLSNITRSISDGDHQAPPKAESGIPFLVISNVKTGVVNFDTVSRWVPESYYDSLKDIRVPKVDDILYTVTGSFGIPVQVKTDEKFCFQRHIAIIKPNCDFTSSRFLYHLLNSDFALRQAEATATGTAQKTVALSSLRSFKFKIPTPVEQTEIVRLVEQHFALADTLEKNLANAKQRVDNLTQSILAKAFKGELVPQDPNDEPAEKLLERIKAAREEAVILEKAAKKVSKKTNDQKGVMS